MSNSYSIIPCPVAQRADAIRLLHASLPTDQQAGLVHALQNLQSQDDSEFAGLLVAATPDELVGVVWAQLTAGHTAIVWLPDLSSPAAVHLVDALANFLDEHSVALAQFLVSPDSTVPAEVLAAGPFQKLAKLAYLTVDVGLFPAAKPVSRLTFQPNANADADRLGKLLLRTYQESRDCPLLNGVRNSADVLAGYHEQGTFAPERWFFVQQEDLDVGALILTVHADSGNWELVYMGLVPESRGAGLGRLILEFAMWQARLGGAERLVLAVDEANQPALDMYQRAGFAAWDYRTVYARLSHHAKSKSRRAQRLRGKNR